MVDLKVAPLVQDYDDSKKYYESVKVYLSQDETKKRIETKNFSKSNNCHLKKDSEYNKNAKNLLSDLPSFLDEVFNQKGD